MQGPTAPMASRLVMDIQVERRPRRSTPPLVVRAPRCAVETIAFVVRPRANPALTGLRAASDVVDAAPALPGCVNLKDGLHPKPDPDDAEQNSSA